MRKKLILSTIVGSVFFLGCQLKGGVDLNEQDEKKVIQIGENVSKKLLQTLKGELVKTLKENPEKAIDVCSQKAIPLTKKVEEEFNHGIRIKRTSFKYRNPSNAPNIHEKEALKYFEEQLKETGKLPKYYLQKVENENGKVYFYYYKPLKIKDVCIYCHGEKKYMDAKLYRKIKTIYPNDKATGYKVGDFRGVIRVAIPLEALK